MALPPKPTPEMIRRGLKVYRLFDSERGDPEALVTAILTAALSPEWCQIQSLFMDATATVEGGRGAWYSPEVVLPPAPVSPVFNLDDDTVYEWYQPATNELMDSLTYQTYAFPVDAPTRSETLALLDPDELIYAAPEAAGIVGIVGIFDGPTQILDAEIDRERGQIRLQRPPRGVLTCRICELPASCGMANG